MTYESTLPPNKETSLLAFDMAKMIFIHNGMLQQGVDPTDSDGNSLYISIIPDVSAHVKRCYGNSDEVNNALLAAYQITHSDKKEE